MTPCRFVATVCAFFAALNITSLSAAENKIQFQYVPDHFEAPAGENGAGIGPCHGGAVIDKAGNIYVTTDTPRGILFTIPRGNSFARVVLRGFMRWRFARKMARSTFMRRDRLRMRWSN